MKASILSALILGFSSVLAAGVTQKDSQKEGPSHSALV